MNARVFVVMGVAGSGKTTIGRRLAQRIGGQFSDADEFHSRANIEKMSSGIALSDEDRLPWLKTIQSSIRKWRQDCCVHVLACSALKAAYRQMLAEPGGVTFVYLKAAQTTIEERLAERVQHYMKVNMAHSQFEALEEPSNEEAIVVSAELTPDEIVDQVIQVASANE